jgi:hypothetical protein
MQIVDNFVNIKPSAYVYGEAALVRPGKRNVEISSNALRSKISVFDLRVDIIGNLTDIEAQVEAFVEHYNHRRRHESLDNVTPADAYFGRAETIIKQRERIKRQTIQHRRLQHRKIAA